MLNFVPPGIFWSHVVFSFGRCRQNQGQTKVTLLIELAYSYNVNGKYPEGCDANKKRSIRGKAEMIFLKNGESWTKRKMNGTTKLHACSM